ncbi:MAG TPA: DNRLRE domain-containing protein, partial [Pyrinomonadaceae bacterium]|nr:DNRLRE domain-containing protein [Pyrinomonadaceae bacterium]
TITWANKPLAGTNALATVQILDNTSRWYYWDITSYVQAEKAAGRNLISLVLKSTVASSPYVSFSSRNASGNQPQLLSGVTTSSRGGPNNDTTYRYRVRAYNAAGNSAYSNTASARTMN